MSNLCQEITLPTDPIQHFEDDGGEIALCILSAINVGKIKQFSDMEELCDLSVRMLDELIDYQEYPVKAAERATRARRSLELDLLVLLIGWQNMVSSMVRRVLWLPCINCLKVFSIIC